MKLQNKVLIALCGVLLASLSASAQSATLSGPMLGYVWSNSEQQLRPLLGVLGSATIGDPIDLGFAPSRVLALDGRHFLASTDGNPSLLFVNVETLTPSIAAIAGAPSGFSQAAGSRTGSTAALYYPEQERVLIVTGLPTSPRVSSSIDLSGFIDPISRLAVNDDGTLLIYSVAGADREPLYSWTPALGYRFLSVADRISDIALAANGDVIVADAGANEVFSIVDPRGSAARLLLVDGNDGVSNPTGVAVSSDNQIYVTNAGSQTILTLDSGGRSLRSESCGCELSGLYALRDSVYRLSGRTDQTMFLLEAGRDSDRVVFVPGLRTSSDGIEH